MTGIEQQLGTDLEQTQLETDDMVDSIEEQQSESEITKNWGILRSSDHWQKMMDERSIVIDPKAVYSYQNMHDGNRDKTLNGYKHVVMSGIYERTMLSDLFFSAENINNVDNQLRYKIYQMSDEQFKLGPQDKTELVLIMRAIFLNYSRHNPNWNITDQVRKLNDLVVEKAIPPLFSNTLQYIRYLEDANESHKMIIALPVNVNNTGTKVLGLSSALGF